MRIKWVKVCRLGTMASSQMTSSLSGVHHQMSGDCPWSFVSSVASPCKSGVSQIHSDPGPVLGWKITVRPLRHSPPSLSPVTLMPCCGSPALPLYATHLFDISPPPLSLVSFNWDFHTLVWLGAHSALPSCLTSQSRASFSNLKGGGGKQERLWDLFLNISSLSQVLSIPLRTCVFWNTVTAGNSCLFACFSYIPSLRINT